MLRFSWESKHSQLTTADIVLHPEQLGIQLKKKKDKRIFLSTVSDIDAQLKVTHWGLAYNKPGH